MSALTLDVPEELARKLSSVPKEQVNRSAVAAFSRLVGNEPDAIPMVIGPVLRLFHTGSPRPPDEDFRPDPLAISNAARWLLQLQDETGDSPARLKPLANASPDGDVVLEWWGNGRKLTVYVSATGAEYVQVWGADIETEMAEGDADSAPARRMLWQWLTTKK